MATILNKKLEEQVQKTKSYNANNDNEGDQNCDNDFSARSESSNDADHNQ